MLVDKQSELMSDLLFTVHQHGGDDVTRKPPIVIYFVVPGAMGNFRQVDVDLDALSDLKVPSVVHLFIRLSP